MTIRLVNASKLSSHGAMLWLNTDADEKYSLLRVVMRVRRATLVAMLSRHSLRHNITLQHCESQSDFVLMMLPISFDRVEGCLRKTKAVQKECFHSVPGQLGGFVFGNIFQCFPLNFMGNYTSMRLISNQRCDFIPGSLNLKYKALING